MIKKTAIFSVLILLMLSCGAFSQVRFPAYSGFVNDFANAISPLEESSIESVCARLESKTSVELALAIVKTTSPMVPKEYAVKLFEQWKLGKKGKDNGILILMAMDEKRVEIEIGYGLEGMINDALAGEYLDKYALPHFKKDEYGAGLYNLVAMIADKVASGSGIELNVEPIKVSAVKKIAADDIEPYQGYVVAAVVSFFVLLIFLSLFASGLVSGVFGAVFGAIIGFAYGGIIGAIVGAVLGFVLSYARFPTSGNIGGGFGGGFGGGSGGGFTFGGGGSGGGGAGRSW